MQMNNIKSMLKERGITQKELAKKLNITENAVNKWFSGVSKPTMSRYEQILELLGLDISQSINKQVVSGGVINNNVGNTFGNNSGNTFTGGNNAVGRGSSVGTSHNNAELVKKAVEVPILSYVQAGEFTHQQESNFKDIQESQLLPAEWVPTGAFLLKVVGKSMTYDFANFDKQKLNPDYARFSIEEGEQVLVDTREVNPYNLEGKVVVAANSDGTTVKLLYREEKGLCLMPLNTEYQNNEYIKRPDDATIIGRVIRIIKIKEV